jgi:hypothetical protein
MRSNIRHGLLIVVLALTLISDLGTTQAAGTAKYKHITGEIEDRITGGKDMDTWANAYKKGDFKVADAAWRKIASQVKPYDGYGGLLKAAHLRFVFADDEKPYDGLALDQHLLKNTEVELGANHPAVGDVLDFLCMACLSRHKTKEAEQSARRMVSIFNRSLDGEDERRAASMFKLSRILKDENKGEESRQIYVEARRLWQKYPHPAPGDGGFSSIFGRKR